jgi:hypothetical protein
MRAALPKDILPWNGLSNPAIMASKLSDSLLEYQQFEPSPPNKKQHAPLATFGRLNSTINESSTIHQVTDLN